jgi:hypothetical protein
MLFPKYILRRTKALKGIMRDEDITAKEDVRNSYQ